MSPLVAPPDRTRDQRMDALAKANEIRSHRARLKRDLKAGRVDLVSLIERPPEVLKTMKIFDLVIWSPKRGEVKASKLLVGCGISPSKTLGGLSDRQRADLVADLLVGRTA